MSILSDRLFILHHARSHIVEDYVKKLPELLRCTSLYDLAVWNFCLVYFSFSEISINCIVVVEINSSSLKG